MVGTLSFLSQIELPGKAFMSRISGMLSVNRGVIRVIKFVEADVKFGLHS